MRKPNWIACSRVCRVSDYIAVCKNSIYSSIVDMSTIEFSKCCSATSVSIVHSLLDCLVRFRMIFPWKDM